MTSLDDRVRQLAAYASPFAASRPIAPAPAEPADFIGADVEPLSYLFGTRGLDVSAAAVGRALERDEAPIPATQNREGYNGDNHFAYWLSGYAEHLRLAQIAAAHGVEGGAIFDFGGSTGRVFRNFLFQSDRWDVWTSDFKRSSVEWNLAHFPPALKAFQGMYFPSLPIDDRSMDLVIAMSVFTHIDETETNWLLELRRILRPGGVALLTTHNEATWTDMAPRLREAVERHSPALAAEPVLPPGRHVSNFRDDDPYRCNVFHSDDYVRAQWGRYFEVLDILPRASAAQAIVVCRRPSARPPRG